MIFQTLRGDILMQVAQYESAKEVWDAIKVRYLGADMVQKARLQTLRSELETLKMGENEKISSFTSKLGGIKSKFRSLGTSIKNKKIVRKLLIYVPKKFLPIVASIKQYLELDKMTFEEVVGKITAFEECLKSQNDLENNNLLMASSDNHSGNWHHGKGRGDQSQGRGRGRSSFRGGRGRGRSLFRGGRGRGQNMERGNRDTSEFKCYECGEFDHFAYECRK
ncbi:uncharacterized protein LOC110889239 [Helianthus annuus]|uniref:uncharacterized protein LOC110889239 n=1 Tax=Helianthus annuus TaxID=4232 RepID=UPI000B8FB89A|nr:uncharacterized protein LOC110889239 [Helianthus annuus]